MVGVVPRRSSTGRLLGAVVIRAKPNARSRLVARVFPGQRFIINTRRSTKDWWAVRVVSLPAAKASGFISKRSVRFIDHKNPFADVARGHWAELAIKELSREGMVQGWKGLFRGQRRATRNDLAVIMARLLRHLKTAQDKIMLRLEAIGEALAARKADGRRLDEHERRIQVIEESVSHGGLRPAGSQAGTGRQEGSVSWTLRAWSGLVPPTGESVSFDTLRSGAR